MKTIEEVIEYLVERKLNLIQIIESHTETFDVIGPEMAQYITSVSYTIYKSELEQVKATLDFIMGRSND
jgi:hypothetical protein